jgi:Fe-S-cluster-containing hydrogenase component 2
MRGEWVKLICGASNQDLPLIRNLCYLYTASGVDCIDMSADPSVVNAANEGITQAMQDYSISTKPIMMVSVNDDEDPHFRKASFDPQRCPADCPRPCERICPAMAIPPIISLRNPSNGVIDEKCYGCGRCFVVCPLELIQESSYTVDTSAITSLFEVGLVNAIEIHTKAGHEAKFAELWSKIHQVLLAKASVIAISFPNMFDDTNRYIFNLQSTISSSPAYSQYKGIQVWQADGKPMSGDIGKGSTHATCELAARILQRSRVEGSIDFSSGRHFVQLAGGANDYSSTLVNAMHLKSQRGFGGYGFGGYARKKISAILNSLEERCPGAHVENHPELLKPCLEFSTSLISTVKVS